MSLTSEPAGQPLDDQAADQAIDLGPGRLMARPGPDLYLYAFTTSGGPFPEIGRRGRFLSGPLSCPARLTDRRGPEVALSLTADQLLGSSLSGRFQPLSRPEPPAAPAGPGPPGAALFLDPRDGWAMAAAEAAGAKESSFDPARWPQVSRADLGANLSPAGVTLIWSQTRAAATALALLQALQNWGPTLAAGDVPADLAPLAGCPGAVFTGPAQPGSPLHPASIYTLAAEAALKRERELAETRRRLAELKNMEVSLQARLSDWADLARLESRLTALGREVAGRRPGWEQARSELADARAGWEKAQIAAGRSGGLLAWVRPGRKNEPALAQAETCRQVLTAAESALAGVRREEEAALAEARRLEQQLALKRLESENWSPRAELELELKQVQARSEQAAAALATVSARPQPAPADFLAEAPLILALTADPPPAGRRFAAVLALVSRPRDHEGRQRLAALALAAEKHLAILGDFTFWPVWSGQAPLWPGRPDTPAWSSLRVAEDKDELKTYLAEERLFSLNQIGPPPAGPRLARLELSRSEADGGPGLRAPGDVGPSNPVSALQVAGAALKFTLETEGPGPAVIILAASRSQSRLTELILADLGAPAGRIFCGQPQDFNHWGPAPLVILEPALTRPHISHPWAWPSVGRRQLLRAWALAGEEIWLAGRDRELSRLPETSPLAALWRLAGRAPASPAGWSRPPAPSFRESLAEAREEVWAILPALESFWWQFLEEPFLAAASRQVKITLLIASPEPQADQSYLGAAIRRLASGGCRVHLTRGFPGWLALVDGQHLTWGRLPPEAGAAQLWSGLQSALLPQAGPELTRILQLRLINEKMSRPGGGSKACPHCGWPLVLINQDQSLGFGDEQPLKIDCLKTCQGRRSARRLDDYE